MSASSIDPFPTRHQASPVPGYAMVEAEAIRNVRTRRKDSGATGSRTSSAVSIKDRPSGEGPALSTVAGARTRRRSLFARKAREEALERGAQTAVRAQTDVGTVHSSAPAAKSATNPAQRSPRRKSEHLEREPSKAVQELQPARVTPSHARPAHRKSPSASAITFMRQQLGMRREVSNTAESPSPRPKAISPGRRHVGGENAPSSWYNRVSPGRSRPTSALSKERPAQLPALFSSPRAPEVPLLETRASTSSRQSVENDDYGATPRNFSLLRSTSRRSFSNLLSMDIGSPVRQEEGKRGILTRSKRSSTVGSTDQPQGGAASALNRLRAPEPAQKLQNKKSTESLSSIMKASSAKQRLSQRTGDMVERAVSKLGKKPDQSSRLDRRGSMGTGVMLGSERLEPVTSTETHSNTSDFSDQRSDKFGVHRKMNGWVKSMKSGSSRSSGSRPSLEGLAMRASPQMGRDSMQAGASGLHGQASGSSPYGTATQSTSASKSRGSLLSSLTNAGLLRGEQGQAQTGSGARGGLDRALRYFMDHGQEAEDAAQGIWILGVLHGPREATQGAGAPDAHAISEGNGVAASGSEVQSGAGAPDSREETTEHARSTTEEWSLDAGLAPSEGREPSATLNSPAVLVASDHDMLTSFQKDFSSRVWCTYRAQFAPISRDGTISEEAEQAAARQAEAEAIEIVHSATSEGASNPSSPPPGILTLSERMGIPNLWSRATAMSQAYGISGRAGLTTDAGWGCMLRTGQSLLANALISIHLGRDWRRAAKPLSQEQVSTANLDSFHQMRWEAARKEHAQYTRILTWFMDEPSSACPFGVHRMAREGKRLGKEVGEWFGPSTAAGAICKLVEEFPACGLGVNVASDGVIYLDQVKSAARHTSESSAVWARPVLILIGIRLGLDGVHPMYHDSVKATFAFPHSVGIAGGRPSSSYYFVGYQGNNLFYLDPHHVRSAVRFKHPPSNKLDDAEWWAQAYTEAELATFHNESPRRMPMKSLDPSMLLGFLILDEAALHDFVERVRSLPRPIFSVLESMPRWMMANDDALDADDETAAVESMSESSGDLGVESEAAEDLGEASRDGRNGQDAERPTGLGRTATNASTATLQTDNTFEVVSDDVAAPAPSVQNGAAAGMTFPTLGSSTDVLVPEQSDADQRIGSAGASRHDDRSTTPRPEPGESSSQPGVSGARLATDERLSGTYSVVSGSDADSLWENVVGGRAAAVSEEHGKIDPAQVMSADQASNGERSDEATGASGTAGRPAVDHLERQPS